MSNKPHYFGLEDASPEDRKALLNLADSLGLTESYVRRVSMKNAREYKSLTKEAADLGSIGKAIATIGIPTIAGAGFGMVADEGSPTRGAIIGGLSGATLGAAGLGLKKATGKGFKRLLGIGTGAGTAIPMNFSDDAIRAAEGITDSSLKNAVQRVYEALSKTQIGSTLDPSDAAQLVQMNEMISPGLVSKLNAATTLEEIVEIIKRATDALL